MDFHIGCAVWAFDGWFGHFYPPNPGSSTTLELYAERMTAVEGNTTFYAVPSAETIARWRDQTPETFRMCPKLHRDITHNGSLMPHLEAAAAFRERMAGLGSRYGLTHLQLPPSYGPSLFDDLEAFVRRWPRREFPLAVELRHIRWYRPPHLHRLELLLEELDIAWVVLDTRPIYEGPGEPQRGSDRRKPKLPMLPQLTAPRTMIRFIGHPDLDENQVYLEGWARRIDSWLRDGIEVYFFAHCPREEHSPQIARRLQKLLEGLDAPVPPLPWDELPPMPSQTRLF